MSTLPSRVSSQIATVQDLLKRSAAQIRLAAPKHCDPERLARIALTTIRQKPDLLKCDALSLVKCVMQAAALGLDVDPLLGRAYLVPFGNECTLIVGYKGLIDLARRSGQIQSVEAHTVHEADHFDYQFGLEPRLIHRPFEGSERGPLAAVWALARFKDGGYQFEVMNRSEVLAIKGRSRASKSGPWVTDEAEMWRKTVLRRLCKFLPLSPEIHTQIAREEMIDAGVAVPDAEFTVTEAVDELPTPAIAEPAPATRSDQVRRQLSELPLEPGSQG